MPSPLVGSGGGAHHPARASSWDRRLDHTDGGIARRTDRMADAHAALSLSSTGHYSCVIWRRTPEMASTIELSFGLKANRRQSDGAAPEHTIELEAVTIRW